MAREFSSGYVRAASSGDCSISDLTQQQQQQQQGERLGAMPTAQVVRLKDGEGSGLVAAERCMALLLPKELSRRVFSQLDYRDLVQCSLVCKKWHVESSELRQGWKEELHWEACSIRGVHFNYNNTSPSYPRLKLYLAGSPD